MSEVLVWNFVLEEALPVNGNVSWGDIVVAYDVEMYCESGCFCVCGGESWMSTARPGYVHDGRSVQ